MSKKFTIASYRKRKQERTHSTEDTVEGFDDFMECPEVPVATQPQGASTSTFLRPVPPKAKIPTSPCINDLTTEPNDGVEEPLLVVSPSHLTPGCPIIKPHTITIANYRKRKQDAERTHSTEDIVQGFDDFMKSTEGGFTFPPPMPKKARIPTPPLVSDCYYVATKVNEKKATCTCMRKVATEFLESVEPTESAMRNRSRHVRSSEIDNGSGSEDDDFDSQPSRKKMTAPNKNPQNSYGVKNGPYLSNLLSVAQKNTTEGMKKLNKGKAAGVGGSRRRGSEQTAKGTGNLKNVGDVWKSHNVKSLGGRRIPKRRRAALMTADDDETTLDLCTVQVGRLVSDAAFNLEINSKELHFQFECNRKVHRHIIELKHLTSWKMNLGDGPNFVAIEVDMCATNKLKSILVSKFHLNNDFFKQGSRDPSQHYIIFCLGTGDDVSPQYIANINEVLDGINGLTLNYCDICRDVSSEEATEFLESVKPTESAMSTVSLTSSKDINELSLAGRDTTDDNAATITGQSSRAPRKQLRPVMRSTRQKRPPRSTYSTSLISIDDREDNGQEEPIVRRPNVKLLTYKPQGSKVTLDIMSADVECLDPGEYLNDKIIDFYLNYLLYEKLSEEFRSRVHVFSTFFYTRLSNASMDDKASNCSTPEKIHNRVKTWTRRVDLFLKDYIILPVCDRAHWYVVIVCYPGRFDPSKVKSPQPRKRNTRSRSGRKSMRLQKRKGVLTASDEIGTEECVEKEGSPSEQLGLNDSLDKKETTTDEADVEDMGEASIFNLPTTNEEAEQQIATTLNSEVAPSTTTGCLHPETGQVESTASTSRDGEEEGEPLQDEVIREADESGSGEKEGATLVENIEVKEKAMEEEDLEPQKRPCIQILDSYGIKRPSTASRIRKYLTMEWKSKKEDELSFEYLPVEYPPIPLQDNSFDSGIFVLQFVESLLGTIQREIPPPSVAEEWASYDMTRAKRKDLNELITSLQQRDKAS